MKRIFQSRFFAYQSDNLKSKIEKRPRGLKWLWLSVIAFVLVVVEVVAQAQQPARIPRIGYVTSTGNSNNPGPSGNAFRQGLRDFGYIEGENIQVEYRFIEGNIGRTADLVAELVQLKVDVLVVGGLTPVRAAKQSTKTVPIVMVTTQDPVAAGMVDSLARPGGNVTGLTQLARDLSGKRLELLKEAIPTLSRVGVLTVAGPPPAGLSTALKEYEQQRAR